MRQKCIQKCARRRMPPKVPLALLKPHLIHPMREYATEKITTKICDQTSYGSSEVGLTKLASCSSHDAKISLFDKSPQRFQLGEKNRQHSLPKVHRYCSMAATTVSLPWTHHLINMVLLLHATRLISRQEASHLTRNSLSLLICVSQSVFEA